MKKKKLHRVSMQLLLLSEAERPRLGRIPAESSIRRTPSWPEPSMAVSAALPEAHSEKANVVAIDSSSKSPCGLSGVAEVFLPRPTPDRRLDRSFGDCRLAPGTLPHRASICECVPPSNLRSVGGTGASERFRPRRPVSGKRVLRLPLLLICTNFSKAWSYLGPFTRLFCTDLSG